MRAVQFKEFGGPEVLSLLDVPEPHPSAGEVRMAVRAVGVNPADWKFRSGAMGGELPRGTGLEAAGIVDEVGEGVSDVAAGDAVFGSTSAGAADFALLSHYARMPPSIDFTHAAALPVAVETATRGLDELGVSDGQTLVINGAAGAVGTAAIQFAVRRGARVIATASTANFDRLQGYGAETTTYGDGLEERVRALAPDGVDRAFDAGPGGALRALVALAGGPEYVIAIADFAGAQETGVTFTGGADSVRAWHALDDVTTLIEAGTFELPVAETFPLERIADAHRASETGHVRGKLVVLVA
jgi:NADPH:quinone reductase-like Zn-dependent oxidoreductase